MGSMELVVDPKLDWLMIEGAGDELRLVRLNIIQVVKVTNSK